MFDKVVAIAIIIDIVIPVKMFKHARKKTVSLKHFYYSITKITIHFDTNYSYQNMKFKNYLTKNINP
jgi:hypothetical protein